MIISSGQLIQEYLKVQTLFSEMTICQYFLVYSLNVGTNSVLRTYSKLS